MSSRRSRARAKGVWLKNTLVLSIVTATFTAFASYLILPLIFTAVDISIPMLFLMVFASVLGYSLAMTFFWNRNRGKHHRGQI